MSTLDHISSLLDQWMPEMARESLKARLCPSLLTLLDSMDGKYRMVGHSGPEYSIVPLDDTARRSLRQITSDLAELDAVIEGLSDEEAVGAFMAVTNDEVH